MLIAPPRGRAEEFARRYAQAAKKEYAADRLKAEMDTLLRTGKDPKRLEYLLELTKDLVYNDPKFNWRAELDKKYHADRYRREPGRWLAEEAWYDADIRTNFEVPTFARQRFVKTPEGVHYFAEELDGGPEIFVAPEIATYSKGSRIAENDLYRKGRAFAEAPAMGYNQDMSNPSYKWAEPQYGLEPKYFPLEDRIEFVRDGTRWKMVGYDKVPLRSQGWGYHVLYKGDDGTWAEWRFQGDYRVEQDDNGNWVDQFVMGHENMPFSRLPESALPPWAHREV